MATFAIATTDKRLDFIDPGSGAFLCDPQWRPAIAQLKAGGTFVDPSIAPGRELVNAEYANATETIVIDVSGPEKYQVVRKLRMIYEYFKQSQNYGFEYWETNPVWLELQANGTNAILGYSRIVNMTIVDLAEVFAQPFFTAAQNESVMQEITLIVEREPFWSTIKPGTRMPVMYNMIKNGDFEVWNTGVGDAVPDFWDDVEEGSGLYLTTLGVTSRTTGKWGRYGLKIAITDSVEQGELKGASHAVSSLQNSLTHTFVAWVKNNGITNGVGKVYIELNSGTHELYEDNQLHGWTRYSMTFTTGSNDASETPPEPRVYCAIETTSPDSVGSFEVDGLMLLEGDYSAMLAQNLLPQIGSAHIDNNTTTGTNFNPDTAAVGYLDIWNIPGDVDSNCRLEILNNTLPPSGSLAEDIAEMYIGLRRGEFDVFKLRNVQQALGSSFNIEVSEPEASSGTFLALSVGGGGDASWTQLTKAIIPDIDSANQNLGRYKVYIRLKDHKTTADLKIRVRYWTGLEGVNDVSIRAVDMPIQDIWYLVDVTEFRTMNIDKKFGYKVGSFGWVVEATRPENATAAQVDVDYAIALPTDGGFTEFDLLNPIGYTRGLGIDNIDPGQSVNSILRSSAWQFYWEAPNTYYYTAFEEWLTLLIIGGYIAGSNIPTFTLYGPQYGLQLTIEMDTDTSNGIFGTVIYLGLRLYWHQGIRLRYATGLLDLVGGEGVLAFDPQDGGDVSSGTPNTWLGTQQPGGHSNITFFNDFNTEYNGELWIPAQGIGFNPGLIITGGIFRHDPTSPDRFGAAVDTDLAVYIEDATIREIVWYGGRLYFRVEQSAGSGKQGLYVWELGNGNDDYDLISVNYIPLIVFQEKLYCYDNVNDLLVRYDGFTFETVYDGMTSYAGYGGAEVIYNNQLYITINGTVHFTPTGDLNSFTPISNVTNIDARTIYNNQLIGATGANLGSEQPIYYLVEESSTYQVDRFKGGNFKLAPRAFNDENRSRFYMSWNRRNRSNVVGDKALAGVAVNPQFLTLINKIEE